MRAAEQFNILFRINADVSLGLGHVSRCRSLMLELSRQADCRFAVMTDTCDTVHQVLTGIAYDLYETGETVSKARFNTVIVDVPDSSCLEEDFRAIADLVVCIDDSGSGLSSQDILIRPNLLDLPRPVGMSEERYWTGQVILHPNFALYSDALSTERDSGKKELLVCFGGSDPGGITLRAVPLLKSIGNDVVIRIVTGAAFPHDEALVAAAGGDNRFILERNMPDLARVLRNADIALISGGTLLYEACALSVPSVVICQNEEQLSEADAAQTAGAVISLGINAAVMDENIIPAVLRLLTDDSLHQRMACAGRLLVSPDGAAQLAARLLSCLERRGRP